MSVVLPWRRRKAAAPAAPHVLAACLAAVYNRRMGDARDFVEKHVEVDDFRIRYLEAGEGPPLVHLHGAGGLRLTPGHALLAQRHRVIALEMPGFGAEENLRTSTQAEMAATIAAAAGTLGLHRFSLWGTSFGGKTALLLAAAEPQRVARLVLEAPAAIRPQGSRPPGGSPDEIASRLYGHPERMPPLPPRDLDAEAQIARLVVRLRGPDRDPAFETALTTIETPTLVLFGTLDRVIPPEMGRHYKAAMPNCNLVLVYDAGHAIASERPDAFCEVVADFLERGEAFVISRSETLINP